ncbi:MAG: RNA-binding protein [Crenarchaeota archaeon]|nr:RNA-binding protein [Thermoproteota archaeon]MCR8453795.1 RNA-binding protein [Thermoproteota archaeon]MCR8455155.1 RNA-binding protein [Thermoproteota archaeon]MCR8471802.1 RNA-binding protein [Thermoproteota archaeon]MCR8487051.1 RNA-binding protein [Thermoproteota archaeon]
MSEAALKPKEALVWSLENNVVVKVKGNKYIRGKLKGFDVHLNLTLGDAQQILDDGSFKSLGHVVVRGDVVIFIVFPFLEYKSKGEEK